MSVYPVLRFLNAFFWEFVQNLGVVLFVLAVWWWARRSREKAILSILASAVYSAVAIYLTEVLKVGHAGLLTTMIVNLVSVILLQLLIVPYSGAEARWSNWRTDWGVGGLAGAALAIAQGLAVQGKFPLIRIIFHGVALAVACGAVLVSVRKLKSRTLSAALLGAILIVVVMTCVIGLIDYSYLVLPPWPVDALIAPGTAQ